MRASITAQTILLHKGSAHLSVVVSEPAGMPGTLDGINAVLGP